MAFYPIPQNRGHIAAFHSQLIFVFVERLPGNRTIHSEVIPTQIAMIRKLILSVSLPGIMRGIHGSVIPKSSYSRISYGKNLDVYLVPMFDDNYCPVIIDKVHNQVACVDPGQASSIIEAMNTLNSSLDIILITHKHHDHVGGNLILKEKYPNVKVIGTQYEHVPGLDIGVGEESTFLFGDNLVTVMKTACHTKGHVSFLFTTKDDKENGNFHHNLLFCGDTLFVGGCGRFFEGDAQDMLANMDRFSSLPDSTAVYCAHEYTESNFKFLASVYPEICSEKYEFVKSLRAQGLPTVPSTIAEEKRTNLFMRCHDSSLQLLLKTNNSPTLTMARLRKLKNEFK